MKTKVFVDGSEGTTGLRIHERFSKRNDIELLTISSELRKDPAERKRLINASDVTFLCLPDAAAEESVSFVENEDTVIIDTSTAHRTADGWAYGFAELSDGHRKAIKNGKRIAVPGCHATGFIALVYPMIAGGFMPADYPVSAFSLTGYSGGGKKMIAAYEAEDKTDDLYAPREYALSQQHKHLKEMKKITGLLRTPLFSPIVDDYYSGMIVTVPLFTDMLKNASVETVREYFVEHYMGQRFITIADADDKTASSGFLSGNQLSGYDGLKIYITGNEERILLSSQFDNLGKGASGAAMQCMNIVLGCDEAEGLNLF
ncbi:MAG: N-acetyl-gamma-glutamyl-phosphate reductase [Lachnospiraceae bacterium]|nr:N-acetyl-gamma-glutamyl-phosphate reductase [Lachnospiraceae bacterium]